MVVTVDDASTFLLMMTIGGDDSIDRVGIGKDTLMLLPINEDSLFDVTSNP